MANVLKRKDEQLAVARDEVAEARQRAAALEGLAQLAAESAAIPEAPTPPPAPPAEPLASPDPASPMRAEVVAGPTEVVETSLNDAPVELSGAGTIYFLAVTRLLIDTTMARLLHDGHITFT